MTVVLTAAINLHLILMIAKEHISPSFHQRNALTKTQRGGLQNRLLDNKRLLNCLSLAARLDSRRVSMTGSL